MVLTGRLLAVLGLNWTTRGSGSVWVLRGSGLSRTSCGVLVPAWPGSGQGCGAMLRGGPALATVFLCSVCLLVAPTRIRRKELCSLDRIKKVTSLNDALPTQMDVSLYTPSVEDYQKCPTAVLSCFADELSVLCEEMKVNGLNCTQQRFILSLRKLAGKFNKSESDCRRCELHPEESPKDFLRVLLNVLQLINSENC